jgi:hypothetical protein
MYIQLLRKDHLKFVISDRLNKGYFDFKNFSLISKLIRNILYLLKVYIECIAKYIIYIDI